MKKLLAANHALPIYRVPPVEVNIHVPDRFSVYLLSHVEYFDQPL